MLSRERILSNLVSVPRVAETIDMYMSMCAYTVEPDRSVAGSGQTVI